MPSRDTRVTIKRRADYAPPAFLIDTVDLAFDLDPQQTEVTTRLTFRRNPVAVAGLPLTLDGEQQDDVRILLDGRPLPTSRALLSSGALAILDPPASGTLTIRSRIAPARNDALEGLYVSSDAFCTQCEPEGFRRITYFPDRPDVLATYRVTIRADRSRYPVLLSNGNRVDEGTLPGGRHFAVWHDPFPKPSYLFALVAGDLSSLDDTFTTMSGRRVALSIYSTPVNLPRCHHAMASLKAAMRWDEIRFGREYDLDRFMIFCADDFNMGAMENKGLNIFNSRLVLADPATATDDDYESIEGVVGHEYFHNWTGNRITCRDWFQLSLKEGLTVFRDQEFSSERGSRAVERIAAVEYLRREQFAEDAGPMAHPVRPDEYQEVNNFYTSTVYEKGAEVIRMQHTLLGADGFRRGMDLYFDRHDGSAVTCDDFVQAMEDASGMDLGQFRRWYSQAGTPRVSIRGMHDGAHRTYTLSMRQETPPTPGQPRKEPFHIPVAVGLLGPDGRDLPLRLQGEDRAAGTTRVLELREAQQEYCFVDVPVAPVPSLLRGFSAPVIVDFDYRADELERLAVHDSDAVNRWAAAQQCFLAAIRSIAAALREGRSLHVPGSLVAVARTLLADEASDPSLLALALATPDVAYVAALDAVIDVDRTLFARDAVMRGLAEALGDELEAAVRRLRPREPHSLVQAQIGARRLRNLCLRYLAERENDDRGPSLALAQYDGADNMTDAIGALGALRDRPGRVRDELYALFEARWRDEPLVLDKWFTLQATAQRGDVLARVKDLVSHPRFNARNPNRVRALVGAFALRNFRAFHAADGTGYRFVADQVLALDPANPQLAAALAGAFNLWKRHTEPRRAAMQAALQRIARAKELSPDVAEVVTRTLANY